MAFYKPYLRPVYTMRLHFRENFNIVVNGVVRDFDGKDQSKTQTHSVNELFTVSHHIHWIKTDGVFNNLVSEKIECEISLWRHHLQINTKTHGTSTLTHINVLSNENSDSKIMNRDKYDKR